MIDLDEIITKDGKSLRQLYSEGHKFLRCKKCNQECTGTWNGLCVDCMKI